MRIRLAYIFELTVLIAIALLAVRRLDASPDLRGFLAPPAERVLLAHRITPFLALLVLGGFPPIIVQPILVRRRETPYGIGRYTWLLTGAMAWIRLAADAVVRTAYIRPVDSRIPPVEWSWGRLGDLEATLSFGPLLLALFLTRRLTHAPADPTPDGHEWAGRLLWLALVAWWLVWQTLMFLRY